MSHVPKVVAGFVSFTEITDPAEHRAYNEWHLFDHLPEQLPLPGIVWGQRWVASPRCRATWGPVDRSLGAVHYVTLYLLAGPVADSVAAFRAKGRALRDAGRFHQHRRALLSGPFAFVGGAAASRVLVSPEAVPYRPNRGVHVRVERLAPGSTAADAVRRRLEAVAAEDGVAGAWVFAAPGEGHEISLTVAWLDDDPVAVAPRLASPAGDGVLLQGVFEAVDPAGPFDWFDGPP